jgi:tetratricopeptide (TPR) repeat protein
MLSAGLKLAAQRDFGPAADYFRKAIRLDPKDPRGHLQLAMALSEAERYAESVEALEQACALAPDQAVYPLYLGVVHLDHDRIEKGREALQQALALDGANALARNYAALAEWMDGQVSEAVHTLLEIDFIQSPPFEARLLAAVEERLAARSQKDDSQERIEISSWPEPAVFFPLVSWLHRWRNRQANQSVRRAGRCAERRKYEEVLQSLEDAAECAPNDPSISEEIRSVQQRCLKELKKNMKKDETQGDLAFYAGCFAWRNKENAKAEEHFRAWLGRRDDKDAERSASFFVLIAKRILCEIVLDKGHARDAEPLLEELKSLDPHDPGLPYLSGRLSLLRKERRAARYAFERFLDREPAFARFRLRDLAGEPPAGKRLE